MALAVNEARAAAEADNRALAVARAKAQAEQAKRKRRAGRPVDQVADGAMSGLVADDRRSMLETRLSELERGLANAPAAERSGGI